VLISGESRNLSVINSAQALLANSGLETLYKFLVSVIEFPYEIIVSLHLLSPIILLFFLIGTYVRNKKSGNQLFGLDSVRYAILSFILWSFLTIIAFASDNGRYTYQPVFFVYFIMLLESMKFPWEYSKKESDVNYEE
jgi:hypothetical protein